MRTRQYSILSTAILFALSVPTLVNAQSKPIQKDEHEIEKLVITSNPLNPTVLESATPVSIIAGDDLESRIAPTLGETLKNVPGVHSTYFGPVSSSPIIRGLDGPRVKILQNGLDASDASRVGPDHVVSTESANATQIEVLRGPATLLYGSGAIGGVVNIVDNRLPVQKRDEIEGKVSYLHDSVSSEDLFNLSVDGGNDTVMWHFDAFDRETENYEIPGSADIDGTEDSGELDNSFIDSNGFTAGLGWASDNMNLAFSFGQLESDYGIPGHSHDEDEHDDEEEDEDHDEHEEGEEEHEEDVFAQLTQDRYQVLFDFHDLEGFFSEFKFRSAYTDYSHSEIEDGEVGTTFNNESIESRLWGKHRSINGWEGVIGLNYTNSDFSALGEEAFTPASQSDSYALFVLEEKRVESFLWQLGFRYEKSEISVDNAFFEAIEDDHGDEEHADEDHDDEIFFEDESFSALSLSAGVVWSIQDNATLSFNYARSERAPSAAEIYSNGLHIATSTYELGAGFEIEASDEVGEYHIIQNQQAPEKEISNNLDITYHVSGKSVEATFSVFYNQIDNYLFQQNTGLHYEDGHIHSEEGEEEDEELELGHDHEDEELAIYLFRQQDADIYGFEAEIDWHFTEQIRLETFADITKAELASGENLPRIPPARIGFGLHFDSDYWHAEVGATYNAKQTDIADYETETAGYTLVNAAFNYYTDIADNELVVFVRGNNLLDKEARVHASFIKDVAPLPGRSIVVGARMNF